jgi:hypothetical protein
MRAHVGRGGQWFLAGSWQALIEGRWGCWAVRAGVLGGAWAAGLVAVRWVVGRWVGRLPWQSLAKRAAPGRA